MGLKKSKAKIPLAGDGGRGYRIDTGESGTSVHFGDGKPGARVASGTSGSKIGIFLFRWSSRACTRAKRKHRFGWIEATGLILWTSTLYHSAHNPRTRHNPDPRFAYRPQRVPLSRRPVIVTHLNTNPIIQKQAPRLDEYD